jgi:hypothetical protein
LGGPLLFSIDTLNRARIVFKDQLCGLKVFLIFVHSLIKLSHYGADIRGLGLCGPIPRNTADCCSEQTSHV